MAYGIEQVRADMAARRAKQAVEGLWNAYYGALTASDLEALREVETLAAVLAQNKDSAERARSLREKVREAIRSRAVSPEEWANHEEIEQARARATVKERFDSLRASRRERDVNAVACYEYSVISTQPDTAAEHLNQAGALGWELVSAIGNPDGRHTMYFRRPVVAARDETGRFQPVSASVVSPIGRIAQSGGGGAAFAAFYYESGADLDADGDVDGGLFDSIQNLFG
jgi:hypothetical protein